MTQPLLPTASCRQPPASRRCPHATHEGNRDVPLTEFGICRARRDGLNLYCKTCIRRNVQQHRANLRQMKNSRGASMQLALDYVTVELDTQVLSVPLALPDRKPFVKAAAREKPSPASRVLAAIHRGARTQPAIVYETKLTKDEVCDALASLLLWTHQVRTQVVGGERKYFLSVPPAVAGGSELPINNLTGFSNIRALMPACMTIGERKAS